MQTLAPIYFSPHLIPQLDRNKNTSNLNIEHFILTKYFHLMAIGQMYFRKTTFSPDPGRSTDLMTQVDIWVHMYVTH